MTKNQIALYKLYEEYYDLDVEYFDDKTIGERAEEILKRQNEIHKLVEKLRLEENYG